MKYWYKNLKKNIKKRIASSLKMEFYELDSLRNEQFYNFIKKGPNCFFRGNKHTITNFDNFEIGENVHIGENSFFSSEGGIVIGDNTHIEKNLLVESISYCYNGNSIPYNQEKLKNKVIIGKNVWIGMNVCIVPGTIIGDGCIIRMGTTVSGNIPPLSIVGSAKCVVIGNRNVEHYQHLENEKRYGGINGEPYNLSGIKTLDELGDTYISRRSISELILYDGKKAVKKTFLNSDEGMRALKTELEAYKRFKDYNWCPRLLKSDQNSIIIEYFPSETRLDKIQNPDSAILEEALWCLLDIFNEGYAHRDFHFKNIFLTKNGLKMIDFETVTSQNCNDFFESYDITGEGLESPYFTENMCVLSPYEFSLGKTFGIKTIDEIRNVLNDRFKKQMLNSSITFQTLNNNKGRHTLQTKNIYSSFKLKNIEIKPLESQRNTQERFLKFGIDQKAIQGKTILDLGSNIGGTLLGLAKFYPAKMLGVEYDNDKVTLSNKLAGYNDISNVKFIQKDIESAEFRNEFKEEFDVVFCLAVIEHLKHKSVLFDLLARICKSLLYFEGNANSDIDFIIGGLKNAGFKEVNYLGFSDDEKNEANNMRPLFIGSKTPISLK